MTKEIRKERRKPGWERRCFRFGGRTTHSIHAALIIAAARNNKNTVKYLEDVLIEALRKEKLLDSNNRLTR